MWATSSMISESGCSESSRGVRLECDPKQRRLTITRGTDDMDASGWNVQLSDQEIVTDLLATLPKLKAAVDDHENRAPNWLRKSKSGDAVDVYELLPTRDGKGDDMDLVHSVVATIEIECHLNEVLNVLTSHKTNHDLEASMRAIIPKKKVRQGEVLLQPHATTLDGAPIRRTRLTQKSSRGGKTVRFDSTSIPEDEEEEDTERKVLVSVSMTRFKSKRRIDVRGRLRNRHQRLQKLCLATLTHQFVGKQRAVHVIKTLPRSVHDQLAPIEEKHQSRSVLGSGLRGLDHISYEVEANVGEVTKKRLCVRCITNVDSCIFEDEDFMAALGPAVIDEDYDYDEEYDEEYESECDYDRRDENDTYASVGSTVACSEFESNGSPDDVSSDLYPENVLERSRALQTLDRLVNSQVKAPGKLSLFERSRLSQSQLYQSSQFTQSQLSQSQSQANFKHPLAQSQLSMSQFQQSQSQFNQSQTHFRDTRDTQLTQSQLSQSQTRFRETRDTQLTQSQLSHSQPGSSRDTQLTQSQLGQSQSRLKDTQLTQSQLSQSQSGFNDTQLTQSQLTQSKFHFQESQLTQSQLSQSQSQFKQSRFRQAQFDESIVAQLRADVEDHLKRTLRATLRDTRRNVAGADESQFSIAPLERDYQLEFDGSQTMSPSHPLPPKPLPAQERRRLQYVISSGALSPTYDRGALNMLGQIAAAHLNCPIGYVTMIDQSTQYVVGLHPRGAIGMSIPREESMCSYTIYHERPLVVKNALNDIRFSHMGFVSQTGLRFYAGFPIRAPDSAVVATICAADYKPHKYISAKQYAEMEALADLASTLIITPDIEIKTAKRDAHAFPRF
ncbi:hypothetical protein PC119_g22323 [Phytophthora cactorum]|uniref:GAF domain-containing protein n=2 Tax=Phytophthora cactorum TaxID=29920 RepID=A0A8T0YD89_9STRA|nr:hypothetical protein PC112_g20658 [Phytophthora cactorum]KAG2800182.1 hypothetical protein PC111_g20080 [Phytophthora cactorum]KAG2833457.1 hypothetical protein PC113_g20562 [Phytophthora cactorum]KAG2975994.1 hypothetical protein PC119_g22323 [Phytophthora cactorum]KAG3058243.1 hypothetical protein PC122_g20758 [Phytophthora cactorum]